MATRGGKAKRYKAAQAESGYNACRQGNGENTVAKAKARPVRHPVLKAGVFGRSESVWSTLTQLDYWAPYATGKYLPDAAPAPYLEGEQLIDRIDPHTPNRYDEQRRHQQAAQLARLQVYGGR